MSGLATAIRLRRRALDRLALALASEQAAALALAGQADDLRQQRIAERCRAVAATLPADAWFAEGTRRLSDLAGARAASERTLAGLRGEAVQVRARLQLLEDARAEFARAERRKRDSKADSALDDRIASGWSRR